MKRATRFLAAFGIVLGGAAMAEDVKTVAVNEYFGVKYRQEPVSFDVEFGMPVPPHKVRLKEQPSQVEALRRGHKMATKFRIWTLVDIDGPGQKVFTVTENAPAAKEDLPLWIAMNSGEVGGVRISSFHGRGFAVRVPVPRGAARFEPPRSAFEVPGPVVSVSPDGARWIGTGYLDTPLRVRRLTTDLSLGPVFFEARIRYEFEEERTYTARVRTYPGKPYVQLVEDFDLGGAAKFVFNFDDWEADRFIRTKDGGYERPWPVTKDNPCGDFITEEGQNCLARLCVWSQFGYFAGKQETIGLVTPDDTLAVGAFYVRPDRWTRAKVNHVDLYDRPEVPGDRMTRGVVGLVGARRRVAMEAWLVDGHREWAIFAAPFRDREGEKRWLAERKKRHEADYQKEADRKRRGVEDTRRRIEREKQRLEEAGKRNDEKRAARSREEIARLEAEIKKRESPLPKELAELRRKYDERYADDEKNAYRMSWWVQKAHVVEGVWPLDRINRMPLAWNADGSPVAHEDAAPKSRAGWGVQNVLQSTSFRSGLAYFNGSNGNMRGDMGGTRYTAWAKGKRDVKAAGVDVSDRMAGPAMISHMMMDESAYPGRRAMLPWTHPEALNPFYQGMENMNFNADRYRCVSMVGAGLFAAGHPEGERIFRHGEEQMDMALDRYVYPQSGCWEESHGYCAHTMKNLIPLAKVLRDFGLRDFFDDERFAKLFDFWCVAHSPPDPGFDMKRVPPPVGDHGLGVGRFAREFREALAEFARSKKPEIRKVARHMAWLLGEIGSSVPEGVDVEPKTPDLGSRWLQGYGSVMRAAGSPAGVARIALRKALIREDVAKKDPDAAWRDATLVLRGTKNGWAREASLLAPEYNSASHDAEVAWERVPFGGRFTVKAAIGGDKWVKGGAAEYRLEVEPRSAPWVYRGRYEGSFNGKPVSGTFSGKAYPSEGCLVVRAGQSWGHHHQDKGSMWFWGRNVHFFGDAAWGAPPGGTYWNPYKQGPASGTQIELVGVTNWTLPCKYPAPWIADDEYAPAFDYCLARCMYPFNPKLDVSKSTPVALRNGYDRQVLFVKPDVIVVRDNVETVCPTVWRMHSYQPDGTEVRGNRATLASPEGVTGELAVLYPKGATLRATDRTEEGKRFGMAKGQKHGRRGEKTAGHDTRSVMLEWKMPRNKSATWVFAVRGEGEREPRARTLDAEGRVVDVTLPDGREAVVFMNGEPFAASAKGIEFEGTVGVALFERGRRRGRAKLCPVRARRLEAP